MAEQSKCDRCIHYVISGMVSNDIMHPVYGFSCKLGCVNCDSHFEEEVKE